jgi:hypothetical protein
VKKPVSKFAFQVHNLQRYTVARCEKLEKKLKKHPMFKADSKAGGAERLALQQFELKAKLDEEAAGGCDKSNAVAPESGKAAPGFNP